MLCRQFWATATLILMAQSLVPVAPAWSHYEHPDSTRAASKRAAIKTPASSFDPWNLLEAAMAPAYAASSNVTIVTEGPWRIVRANGIPDHATGTFPNQGNPNTIREQNYNFRMPVSPRKGPASIDVGINLFGVALNGIPFDPGTAEFWNRDPSSGWWYEAMALGPRLGLDQNNAHVQPNGSYHYHGIPVGLMEHLASQPKPTLLGYAADGFPIYGPFGHAIADNAQSSMTQLKSSYRLKMGQRGSGPGGDYDGTFVQDYEYAPGWGDLDECNGRTGVTAEYPQGTYHYVITDAFPFIPRKLKGSPDPSFQKRRGPGPGPGGRPGGRFGGPPGGFPPPGMGPPPGGPFGQPPPGFGPPGPFDPPN